MLRCSVVLRSDADAELSIWYNINIVIDGEKFKIHWTKALFILNFDIYSFVTNWYEGDIWNIFLHIRKHFDLEHIIITKSNLMVGKF